MGDTDKSYCEECANEGAEQFCQDCFGCENCCGCGSKDMWIPVFMPFDDSEYR